MVIVRVLLPVARVCNRDSPWERKIRLRSGARPKRKIDERLCLTFRLSVSASQMCNISERLRSPGDTGVPEGFPIELADLKYTITRRRVVWPMTGSVDSCLGHASQKRTNDRRPQRKIECCVVFDRVIPDPRRTGQ